MARVKGAMMTRKRRNKTLKLAKSFDAAPRELGQQQREQRKQERVAQDADEKERPRRRAAEAAVRREVLVTGRTGDPVEVDVERAHEHPRHPDAEVIHERNRADPLRQSVENDGGLGPDYVRVAEKHLQKHHRPKRRDARQKSRKSRRPVRSHIHVV